MKILISITIAIVLLLPATSMAAIQFDFMSKPAALSHKHRDQFIEKLKEIDIEEIKEDIEEAGEQLPDSVKELPEKATEVLAEEGIDAPGLAGGIWSVFSDIGSWMSDILKGVLVNFL